jgi:hypothetical protein
LELEVHTDIAVSSLKTFGEKTMSLFFTDLLDECLGYLVAAFLIYASVAIALANTGSL